jgi:hypothetical protein
MVKVVAYITTSVTTFHKVSAPRRSAALAMAGQQSSRAGLCQVDRDKVAVLGEEEGGGTQGDGALDLRQSRASMPFGSCCRSE